MLKKKKRKILILLVVVFEFVIVLILEEVGEMLICLLSFFIDFDGFFCFSCGIWERLDEFFE